MKELYFTEKFSKQDHFERYLQIMYYLRYLGNIERAITHFVLEGYIYSVKTLRMVGISTS